jgi:hypothetical protein
MQGTMTNVTMTTNHPPKMRDGASWHFSTTI